MAYYYPLEYAVFKAKNFRTLRLDGKVPMEERAGIIKQFQDPGSNIDGILVSVKVAGVGLTLTAATRMILMDPWWNPAVDAQAVDRMYRIGQKHPVRCYRFISRGTIEEQMFNLQTLKRGMERTTFGSVNQLRYVGEDELKRLVQYCPDANVHRKLEKFNAVKKINPTIN